MTSARKFSLELLISDLGADLYTLVLDHIEVADWKAAFEAIGEVQALLLAHVRHDAGLTAEAATQIEAGMKRALAQLGVRVAGLRFTQ